jgi:hypothetical protein
MHRKNPHLAHWASLGLLGALALGCGGNTPDHGGSTTSGGTGGGAGGGADSGAPPAASIQFLDQPMPVDLTPDGSLAVLEETTASDANVYFYDTIKGDLTLVTSAGDPSFDVATGVSAKGRVSAVHGNPAQAGLWSKADGWKDLGNAYPTGCDVNVSGAFDVSADGSVAVGLLWHGCSTEAFRWTDTGGAGTLKPLQVLGSPPAGSNAAPNNRATVVSDDGQVAAGFAQNGDIDRSPAVWSADGTGFLLDPAEQDTPAEVLSISADGKMVAGVFGTEDGFVWTKEAGMAKLGPLPGGDPGQPVYPNAIAAGGQLVFGGVGDPFMSVPTAFVWTASKGMRALSDVAVAQGVTIPAGYQLTVVMAASVDGTVLLGGAYDDQGMQKTFVLTLPASAYGLP